MSELKSRVGLRFLLYEVRQEEGMLFEGSLGSMTDRIPPSPMIGQSGRG